MALSEAQKRKIEEEEQYRVQVSSISTNKAGSEKYGVPALLSFFIPGLGQIAKGQTGKGIGIFFGWLISWVLVITVIGTIVPVIIWVWQIVDAYNN